MPPVRGSKSSAALADICGNGRRPGVADTSDRPASKPGVGVFPDFIDIRIIGFNDQAVDIVIIITVFWGIVYQHLANALAFFPGKITFQSIP